MCEQCHQPDWYCRYKKPEQITNIKTGTEKGEEFSKLVDKIMKPKKVYLAIPYTWNATESYRIANKVAADLMDKGYVVFSPISHSHVIADNLHPNLRYSQTFWMNQDLPLIEWADEVHVVCIGEYGNELISNSTGCQSELSKAKELSKPIKIIEYYE